MLARGLCIGVAAVLAISVSSCSQSDGAKSAAKTDEKSAEKTPEPPKRRVIEPVDFKKLQAFLPESLPEMPRKSLTGEFPVSSGAKTSNAKALYVKDDQTVELEILDFADIKDKIPQGYWWVDRDVKPQQLKEGHEETGYLQQWYKYYEHYDSTKKIGKFMVHCGGRFIVSGVSQNLDTDIMKKAVNAMDLTKLSKTR